MKRTKSLRRTAVRVVLRLARIALLLLVAVFLLLAIVNIDDLNILPSVLQQAYTALLDVFLPWQVRLVAFTCFLVACALYILCFRLTQLKTDKKTPEPEVEVDRALALRERAVRDTMVDPLQARLFALAIAEPFEVRERVVEEYTAAQRTLYQRVYIDFSLPNQFYNAGQSFHASNPDDAAESSMDLRSLAADHSGFRRPNLVLPIVVPYKGQLLDGFHVEGADGSRIATLSYRQYLEMAAITLRLLFTLAYGPSYPRGEDHAVPAAVEFAALLLIMRRGNIKPREVDGVVGAIDKLKASKDQSAIRLAARMVSKLAVSYAIIVAIPMPPDARVTVKYSRIHIPGLQLSTRGRLRILLGARPVKLKLSIINAWTCQSYHLRVHVPEGLYLAAQNGDDLERYRNEKRDEAPTRPYWRFRRRLGQPYSHFYVRYLPEPLQPVLPDELQDEESTYPRRTEPGVEFEFGEVPPGSIFRASVASFAAAALIWLVGSVVSVSSKPDLDAPALLLAFPAVAAAWLGFEAPSKRLLEGTLIARISLVCTAVLSVLASALFIVQRTENWDWLSPSPMSVSIVGVERPWWSLLVLAAVVNAAVTSYYFFARTWAYTRLSTRERKTDVSTTLRV